MSVFRHVPAAGATPGYFQFVNASGVVVVDSRDKLFRVTDVLIGNYTFGFLTPPVDSRRTQTLGSCNALADFVMGYARAGYSQTYLDGVPETGWFNVSGSYVHAFGSGANNSGGNTNGVVAYSFEAAGGVVTLEERIAMAGYNTDVGQSLQYTPPTLYYELWIGTFT